MARKHNIMNQLLNSPGYVVKLTYFGENNCIVIYDNIQLIRKKAIYLILVRSHTHTY